ncbi:hypothetical protein IAT38_003917 [Cryptococcus sp. DSM 104549]
MCHESPTSQFLGAMITTPGTIFVFYHIWAYDKGKCLLFTRRSAFRWAIVWMFILSMFLFMAWNIILVWVKYQEWYEVIPVSATESKIIPAPYQHWDPARQSLVRGAYQLLAIAWLLVLAIHSEETLYWAYLIRAIRGKDSKSWFQSTHFKIWVALCLMVCGALPGVANIETEELTVMEDNIFLAGFISALVLFIGSIWLLIVFPGFIRESRRQGANPDVVARLQYFKAQRLAVDGRTPHKYVNSSPFWLDVFYTCGLFFVFTSNGFSLMILLPRNMATEAGIPENQVFIRRRAHSNRPNHPGNVLPSTSTVESTAKNYHPYTPSPSDLESGLGHGHGQLHVQAGGGMGRRGSNPWEVLGERLNLEKEMEEDAIQLAERGARVGELSQMTSESDKPFAANKGERILGDGEHFTEPQLLNHFRSPADFAEPPTPRDLNIVVVTDTVVEKE